MATEANRQRNATTEANEAMGREFNKNRGDPTPRRPNKWPDQREKAQDADDVRERAIEQANEAARVRKPFP